MSREAIEILKRRMTLEERKNFVSACIAGGRSNFFDSPYDRPLSLLLSGSFVWVNSPMGRQYWAGIYSRFSQQELRTLVNFKEV